MHKIVLTITLALSAFSLHAQDFNEEFGTALRKGDTTAQKQVLQRWQSQNPNSADLYAAYFNYYVNRSMEKVIAIKSEAPDDSSFEITDSTGKTVGYIGHDTRYDDARVTRALNCIDTGIKKFPARLDLRFGKIYFLSMLKDYDRFTTETIKTIDYGATIKNKWTWTDDKPVNDPVKFMTDAVQGYIGQLFDTQNDSLAINIQQISEVALKYFPQNVEFLSDLSVSWLLRADYKKALPPLLKAEKLAPSDYIILGNLGHTYKEMGDKKNAIKYYELYEKYGDEEAKAFAKKELDLLNKQ